MDIQEMLTFFPTPYPDELWYSALCRYHMRSGNVQFSATAQELFGNPNISVSIFFANQDFGGLFGQLPDGLLSQEQIYHQHTIISYALRFASSKRKQASYDFVLRSGDGSAGSNMFGMPDNEFLRYCPLCAAEDEAQYGEMYWHRTHQIKLMPLCPKHHCRIENSTIKSDSALRRRFISPSQKNCAKRAPSFLQNSFDKNLTEMLYAFLMDPTVNESGFWCAPLTQCLKNQGFFLTEVEAHLVWDGMFQFYGKELMSHFFSQDRMQQTLYRMLKAQWTSPEQYALLAVYLQMQPCWLTSPGHYVQDTMRDKLLQMATSGFVWAKSRVASELCVTTWGLDAIIKRLGIPPFWKTFDGAATADETSIMRIRVSVEEKEQIAQRADKLGTADITEFVKYCIRKEMSS